VGGDIQVHHSPTVVTEHDEHEQHAKRRRVGTVKKSIDAIWDA
jgi:hypothetical protein